MNEKDPPTQRGTETQRRSPQWDVPSLEEELEELERTADALGVQRGLLVSAYQGARLTELSDADWKQMENSDSKDTEWTPEAVRAHLKGKRDFGRIERGIIEGATLPAPIVLYRKNHPPYLIAGNSRLLACRALDRRPMVLEVRLEK